MSSRRAAKAESAAAAGEEAPWRPSVPPWGRAAARRPLVIERPDLQNWRQRALFGAMTALFWALWILLWLPVITMFGWLAFGYQFKLHMIDLAGYRGFLQLLGVYALIIAALCGALVAWAKYNHLRFRGVERRRTGPPPSLNETAYRHGVDAAALERWRALCVLTVHHDADGRIAHVDEPATAATRAARPHSGAAPHAAVEATAA